MKKSLIIFLILITGIVYTVGATDSFISINPIGDKYVGDYFTITATTNLPVNQDILVEVYSTSFHPASQTSGPIFSRTVKVTQGDSGDLQKISCGVDTSPFSIGTTSTFTPNEYLVKESTTDQLVIGNTLFNLLEGTGSVVPPTPTTPTPTPTPTQSPTPTPTQSPPVTLTPTSTTVSVTSYGPTPPVTTVAVTSTPIPPSPTVTTTPIAAGDQSGILNQILNYFKGIFGWK